jgi:F-box domain
MEEGDRGFDWSELHQELVYLISKKLPDLSDFVRLRAVCKRWRSAVPRFDPSPRFPWIYQHRNSLESDFDFYSLPHAKTITFESTDKVFGSVSGMGYPATDLLTSTFYRDN